LFEQRLLDINDSQTILKVRSEGTKSSLISKNLTSDSKTEELKIDSA